MHTLSASRARITAAAFSARGDWLALGCQALGQLLVWEWRTERYVLRQQVPLPGPYGFFQCLGLNTPYNPTTPSPALLPTMNDRSSSFRGLGPTTCLACDQALPCMAVERMLNTPAGSRSTSMKLLMRGFPCLPPTLWCC